MAAARALACEDILIELFKNLALGPVPVHGTPKRFAEARKAGKNTLACSARVCHAFSGPALKVLWRTIWDIECLFRILPSYDRGAGKKMLTSMPTEKDWARFEEYASRIEELYRGYDSWNSAIWTVIAHRNGASIPLLPRLRRLELPVGKHTPHMMLLISPALKHLQLHFQDGSEASWDFVADGLRATADSLCSLSIRTARIVATRTSEPIPSNWHLTQLQILCLEDIPDLTPPMLEHLSSLPCLRDLTLRYGWDDDTEFEDVVRYPLPLVEKIRLSSTLPGLANVLGVVSFAALSSLEFEAWYYCHILDIAISTDLPPILSALPSGLRRLHVAIACISCDDKHHLEPAGVFATLAQSQPGLEDVSFTFQGFLGHLNTNEMLLAAAGSWPNLTSYRLAFQFGSDSVHRPTNRNTPPWYRRRDGSLPSVATLIRFAESHPRLRHLHLPGIDMCGSLPSRRTFVPALNHGLRSLDLSFLQQDRPLFELALILDKLFPNLDLTGAEDFAVVSSHSSGDPDLTIHMLHTILLALQIGRRHPHGLDAEL
ncbi:hypothetical protein OH77DRAFT_1010464 [Trametes cingulata]|nr:hypothetical protein OH77DRAFT_1010464 [Trametes cingulata]